jgi:hypothetical protein
MSFSGIVVSRARDELRLTDIAVLGTQRGERVVFECRHCRGVNILPTMARGGKVLIHLSHVIATASSRLIVDVTRAGSIGRFKEYRLNPQLSAHRLIGQGCLAIDVYRHISCTASGKVDLEVGPGAIAAIPPSCPGNPCLAVTRTTGYQIEVGQQYGVSAVHLSGYILAWTITLAAPSPYQASFFEANEGGPAEAGVAILRPQPQLGHGYKLMAQSPTIKLRPYFGSTVQFPLEKALPVDAGDVVALTVPTWTPALAVGLNQNEGLWRASRQSGQCSTASEQASDTQVGSIVEYSCLYSRAVLTYSATLSPDVSAARYAP